MPEDILTYTANTDSDDSDVEQREIEKKYKNSSETPIVQLYDDDDDNNDDITESNGNDFPNKEDESNQVYSPVVDVNFFTLSDECTEVILCLQKNQHLLVCGQFNLQIIKGGITYNNVHYNSGYKNWEFWHPACNAISPIMSSFYAGWESKLFLSREYQHLTTQFESYDCVLKISNGYNITELSNLLPELRDMWGPLNISMLPGIARKQLTFNIISKIPDSVRILDISTEWSTVIDEMRIFHANSSQDMRVMVIGGKNSGKSTLMRLLVQKFLHSNNDLSDEAIHYLDIDPGQPEYSPPESISWNKVDPKSMSLGQHLCQGRFTTIKQHFIGSSSPQDWPETYSNAVESLLKEWQTENFMGTSFLNIPGWIKGFGVKIINHALDHFKPTHIIFLSYNGLPFSSEIKVPDTFSTTQRSTYKPIILQLHSPPVGKHISHTLQRFNAAKIRQFKITAYLHKKYDRNFVINPLVMQKPQLISIGNRGIIGFEFLQYSNNSLYQDDIKLSLDGTVVALHRTDSTPDVLFKGIFPVMKNYSKINTEFVGLALIHSIDLEQSLIYVYIPENLFRALRETENKWVLVRGKTETPICELYPNNGIFKSEVDIPYVSLYQKKRHEHVWKVRKNVMRRGHHMK